MKNILYKKWWNSGTKPEHVEHPPIALIKETYNTCNALRNEKTCSVKVRLYTARLIDLNECSDSLPGANLADKIYVTELNKTILNRMPNSWSKQSYVQGFDCESISF